MTNHQHPITPAPELFAEWLADALRTFDRKVSEDDRGTTGLIAGEVAIQAARWGSDQELEACCEWFVRDWTDIETADKLRAARRPKPPSLKEQARAELDRLIALIPTEGALAMAEPIRRALEQLDD